MNSLRVSFAPGAEPAGTGAGGYIPRRDKAYCTGIPRTCRHVAEANPLIDHRVAAEMGGGESNCSRYRVVVPVGYADRIAIAVYVPDDDALRIGQFLSGGLIGYGDGYRCVGIVPVGRFPVQGEGKLNQRSVTDGIPYIPGQGGFIAHTDGDGGLFAFRTGNAGHHVGGQGDATGTGPEGQSAAAGGGEVGHGGAQGVTADACYGGHGNDLVAAADNTAAQLPTYIDGSVIPLMNLW